MAHIPAFAALYPSQNFGSTRPAEPAPAPGPTSYGGAFQQGYSVGVAPVAVPGAAVGGVGGAAIGLANGTVTGITLVPSAINSVPLPLAGLVGAATVGAGMVGGAIDGGVKGMEVGDTVGRVVMAPVGAVTGAANVMRYEAQTVAALGSTTRLQIGQHDPAARPVDPRSRLEPSYQFGDWTRGIVAQGRIARGGYPEQGYRFGDFTRGLFAPTVAHTYLQSNAPTQNWQRAGTTVIQRNRVQRQEQEASED